ncbi:hypothetical protein DM860_004135 [Cuscuta australis]|uniref:Uncharacterized protein n=1 Tax=Cuscuta australis TaxID=267555 RepID=A0A328D011_9ASTE|nr:hypothetical protein DM860_004135 [Cuscuta australis]
MVRNSCFDVQFKRKREEKLNNRGCDDAWFVLYGILLNQYVSWCDNLALIVTADSSHCCSSEPHKKRAPKMGLPFQSFLELCIPTLVACPPLAAWASHCSQLPSLLSPSVWAYTPPYISKAAWYALGLGLGCIARHDHGHLLRVFGAEEVSEFEGQMLLH